MGENIRRRSFLSMGVAGLGVGAISPSGTRADGPRPPAEPPLKIRKKPPGQGKLVVVSSENGLETVARAAELIREGADPLDAAIAGVSIVEADPNDHTVGLGGIPNEDGVVELDAAVMHGPTHRGGAVASLRNIMHPASVAKLVMERTDHCLLVGEGALKFARMHGIPETDLLTEEAREIWLYWKESLNAKDDRIPPPVDELSEIVKEHFGIRKNGTIHCSALDTHGDLGCVTTTSGLFYKIPGRVGDSPILGAGLYLNNKVGSAGSTGRGEANLLNLSSFLIVEGLRRGLDPKDAALEACKRVAENNVDPRLRDDRGRPRFNVKFYCVAQDGRHGGASLWSGAKMAVCEGDEEAKLVDCAALFEGQPEEEL